MLCVSRCSLDCRLGGCDLIYALRRPVDRLIKVAEPRDYKESLAD